MSALGEHQALRHRAEVLRAQAQAAENLAVRAVLLAEAEELDYLAHECWSDARWECCEGDTDAS